MLIISSDMIVAVLRRSFIIEINLRSTILALFETKRSEHMHVRYVFGFMGDGNNIANQNIYTTVKYLKCMLME